ncbi:MAG: hypothetical protein ACP5KV_05195 [Candidatus Methanomethylicaceae archaeon]
MSKKLILIGTEGLPDEVMDFAKVHYRRRFSGYLEVESSGTKISLEPVPFRSGVKGKQYLADEILKKGMELEHGIAVIVITSVDIYTLGTNYIFGLATHGAGLVSYARIDPRFWDFVPEIYHYSEEGKDFLFKQIGKVLLHEFGHALSLGHCDERGCVMRYSNSPIELYNKGEDYCRRCWDRIAHELRE